MKSSHRRDGVFARILMLVCLGLCASVAAAQTFEITVDTSAIAGTNGYVDLQLNPADLLAPTVGASILDWTGSITLIGAPLVEGDVTGALPATVELSNSTAFNDYFQAVQFTDAFRFLLQFTGNASIPPSSLGTSFALSLYAANGLSPLLTGDASGSIVRFELLAGDVSYQTFGPAQVSPVPLPAAVWLLLSGMAGVLGVSRFRRS